MFKQFHYTLRVEWASSVWNGLSVMELANVLVPHMPLPRLSRASTARHLT